MTTDPRAPKLHKVVEAEEIQVSVWWCGGCGEGAGGCWCGEAGCRGLSSSEEVCGVETEGSAALQRCSMGGALGGQGGGRPS